MTSSLDAEVKTSELLQLPSQRGKDLTPESQYIERLFRDIYLADDAEKNALGTKKAAAISLAKELERIMLDRGQPESLNQICSLICSRFEKDKRHSLSVWIIDVLDDKYKQILPLEDSTSQSAANTADLPVECSIMGEKVLRMMREIRQIDHRKIPPKIHQELLHLQYDDVKEREDHCDTIGIAYFNPHTNKSGADSINDYADDEFDEKIEEPPLPIPLDTRIREIDEEAFDDTINLADDLRKWAQLQIDKSRSQTIEQAVKWRDAVAALRIQIRQYIDGKARRSIVQWSQINKTMAEHGGTAASSKSARPVTDPSSGQQLVDPKTGSKVFRNITKEQIDARGPQYCSEMDFISRAMIFTDMLEYRFQVLTNGIRDFRAYAARDKLSRKA